MNIKQKIENREMTVKELEKTCLKLLEENKKLKNQNNPVNESFVDISNYWIYPDVKMSDIIKYDRKEQFLSNMVFKTEEEAIRLRAIDNKVREYIYKENLKYPIDWNNNGQFKYFIYFDFRENKLKKDVWTCSKYTNGLYCTNENILEDLINLVGKEDLEWYVKRDSISNLNVDLDNL